MAKAKKSVEKAAKPANQILVLIAVVAICAVLAGIFLVSQGPGQDSTGLAAAPAAANGGSQDRPVSEITTFTDLEVEIETVDGKPVIRLFSTTWCSHCIWIKASFDKVAREYITEGKIVAMHWEVDITDDTLTPENEGNIPQSELAVFRNENPNGKIPFFVFAGKYARIGNGYEPEDDLLAEEAEFRAVIEALLEELEG